MRRCPNRPHDVIEEYTRTARLVECGRVVSREALSEPELLEFAGLGTLEAFNTDGLRTLIETLDVPSMREKTMRYPGHRELMLAFRETGLFSREPIDVNGVPVRPLDVMSTLMFPKWTYEEGEADLTVMRVIAEGELNGCATRLQWDLFDRYDHKAKETSMARTTAFPCTIIARMLANGEITETGVLPPEILGEQEGMLDRVLDELQKRGVHYDAEIMTIDDIDRAAPSESAPRSRN